VKFLSWLIGAPVAVIAIVFAVINRHDVLLDLWPLPWEIQLPLYLLVLGALALGLIVGGALVWISAGSSRGRARSEGRRANAMAYEVDQLRQENQALQSAAQGPKAISGPSA
jgi:uncharacterized integral membrane protein